MSLGGFPGVFHRKKDRGLEILHFSKCLQKNKKTLSKLKPLHEDWAGGTDL